MKYRDKPKVQTDAEIKKAVLYKQADVILDKFLIKKITKKQMKEQLIPLSIKINALNR